MKIIKGKGLILRHAKLSDAKVLFEIEQDKDTQKNMMSCAKRIKEVENSLKKRILDYKKKKPSGEKFVIEVDGEVAGDISIHDLNEPNVEHRAVISYSLHPKFRGKGITTKAVRLIVNYAFRKYKLKRLSARCRTFNKASARVLEKAGFKLEGIHRKELKKNGQYLDNMYWAIVR
ncbi:MAG: GNAT family protein [Candidatus Pacearchaeota archaeon]|nr:GNAT family protein [Candidatus Pacearchaeota archaeon]